MPVNAGIYSQVGRIDPPPSQLDSLARAYALQEAQMKAQQGQQAFADDQAARGVYAQGGDVQGGLMRAGLGKLGLAYGTADLANQKTRGDIAKDTAETDTKKQALTKAKREQAMQDIAGYDTPEQMLAGLADHEAKGDIDAIKAQAVRDQIQQAQNFPALQVKMLRNLMAPKDQVDLSKPVLGGQSLGGNYQYTSRDPLTGAVTVNSNAPMTQTPDSVASNERMVSEGAANRGVQMRGQNMIDARTRENTAATRENTAATVGAPFEGTDLATGQPIFLQRGKDGRPVPVEGYGPKGQTLKPIPPTVNMAIMANQKAGNQLDRALTLLEGQDVAGMKGDKNATGWKGMVPDFALNRIDPQGTDARAEIADIGSMKIHDRSGAAVTISEAPRLMPFIPKATDDAATVVKKLKRLKLEIANESQAMNDIYSKDQGYRPSPVLAGGGPKSDHPADISNLLNKYK